MNPPIFRSIFIGLLLLTVYSIAAQSACGPITLRTQKDVNSFSCSSITGDLIIDDDGTIPITSLEPIFNGGLNGGAKVTGSVSVLNCNSLTTLEGLDGIGTIGGRFNITNCQNLSTIYNGRFTLKRIEDFLVISNCPKLTEVNALINLTYMGSGLDVVGDVGIKDYSGFNNVTFSPVVEILSSSSPVINGFNSLENIGWFNIDNNNGLVEVTGFNSLKTVKPTQGSTGTIWNRFNVSNNSLLKAYDAHPNITSSEQATIRNNPNLSDCCSFLPVINSNPSPLNISGNAFGCNTVNQIDAPPTIGTCPPDFTVNTANNLCEASFNINHPTASDNCDYDELVIKTTQLGSPTSNTFMVTQGGSNNFNAELDIYTFEYIASDHNGNTANCFTEITIVDEQPPLLTNIPPNVTIGCDDNFPAIPSPTVSDNCDGSPALTAASSVSMGGCGLGIEAEVHEYSWTATDDFGNEATGSWKVTVLSDFSFDLGGTVSACEGSNYNINPGNIGESYQWSTGATSQSITISNSGTYTLTVTTVNGCCFEDAITINFEDPPNASATGATLSCSASQVQIMGASTSAGVTYSWSGPGGFTSNVQNPMVSSIGTYTLIVSTAGGCTASATATVTADNDVPQGSADGGTLTCDDTTVQLSASSTTSGVSYSWTGPSGFNSSQQNPVVAGAGTYTVSIEGSNGCVTNIDVEVIADNEEPVVNVGDGELNCAITSLLYELEGDVLWEGPGGFTSAANTVELVNEGTYNVTVTGDNGCTSSETFLIMSNLEIPNVSAEGAVLTCDSPGGVLMGSSTTPNVSYLWTGPNGFMASFANPVAVALGTYTLQVTGENGCTATVDVEVVSGEDAPILTLEGGTIDCNNTSIELSVSASQENLDYIWSGPNGFTQEGATIQVMTPGNYSVIGTNADGCSGSTQVEVLDNTMPPDLEISAPNLSCEESFIQPTVNSLSILTSYAWTGPDGFTSNDSSPEITLPGVYTLTATAENGCSATVEITVESDTEIPTASATGGTLTCTENSIALMGESNLEDVTYQWTGPDNYFSGEKNPTVSVTGKYFLTVIADNGCLAVDSTEVLGDPDLPSISATGGTINCLNQNVTLMGSTSSVDATIKWEGPNGFETSEPNPTVDIAGTYTFTVTSAGNCVVFSTVQVVLDIRRPDILLSPGSIDCDDGNATFNVQTNAFDGEFSWVGPDGFTSDVLNADYTKAGTYTLTIVDDNGCSSQGTIEIESDIGYEVDLQINGNDVNVEIIGGTGPFTIVFNGSIEASSVNDLNNGDHFVTIEDGLGCEKIIDFTIMSSSTDELINPDEVDLYPNPVTHALTLAWDGTENKFSQVDIYHSNGARYLSSRVSGKSIVISDLEELSSGIYVVKLKGDHSIVTKKFLLLK